MAAQRGRWFACSLSQGLAYLLALCHLAVGGELRRWSLRERWRTFDELQLVQSRESRYQHLDLGYRDGLYVVRQDGLRAGIFPDEEASRRAAALLLTQHPLPVNILVVGGGLGGLCQHLIQAGEFSVGYVEMDPEMISLYRKHLPEALLDPLRTERFTAYACDGRYFVQNAGVAPERRAWRAVKFDAVSAGRAPRAPYDLVVIDIGDPTSASANRFYTREFFLEVRRILAPAGVVAVCGITDSDDYLRGPVLSYTACLYGMLRTVFPRIVVQPGTECCLFAGPEGGPSGEPDVLAHRSVRELMRCCLSHSASASKSFSQSPISTF